MSEEKNICQNCSHENKLGAKFCVHCGNTIIAVPEEKLNIFKSYLEDMLLDGDDPRENADALITEAVEEIGIPVALARKIFEEVCNNSQSQSNVGIRISYDSQLAKSGVAQGNTILKLRVENLTNKSFGSVSVALTHPEEGIRLDIGKIRTLGGQKTKELETTLRFNLVGAQLIAEGQVKVEALSGVTDVYVLASPIRMSTENSNASRHMHTSVNQTITTNGGGVVDGSGFQGGGLLGQSGAASKSESWEYVRLMRSNIKDKVQPPGSIPNDIELSVQSPILSEVESVQVEDSAPTVDQNQTPSFVPAPIVAVEETIDLGADKTDKIDDLANSGDMQAAKLAAINEFSRLLALYPKIQTVSKGRVYLSTDIDLHLLTTIASAAKIKRGDVCAIAVNKTTNDNDELESVEGDATVFSGQGLITLTTKNGNLELVDKYGWSFLTESAWGVFKQNFGKGSYILSIGDETTDYSLPNLTFDLRKNNGKVDVDALYVRLHSLFEKTKSLATYKEPAVPEVIEEQVVLEDEAEELLDIPDEETEYDELEIAVRQFFAMFAFVSQHCDEANDRPIHVYIDEEDGGDVDVTLASNIQALFPRSKLIAICEEDLDSTHDQQGRIRNWTGLASAITRDGIFHVNSDGNGQYDISSKQAFLSWGKFFEELKADLIVRWNVPDVWLGTPEHNYIKGAYIDFSSRIDSFIYFEEVFHNDLRERFEALREIIENA